MNIQMILSALPTQLSGKPEAGANQGQFALALSHAANASHGGSGALPAQLDVTLSEGFPQTMAAQQALLQALETHPTQLPDGEATLAQPDAQLSEIMARLALIEGSHLLAGETDLPALAIQESSAAADGKVSELAEQPQAATLVAAAMVETSRLNAIPSGDSATRPDQSAMTASLTTGTPLAAQLATVGPPTTPSADRSSSGTATPADFTSAFAKVTAAQSGTAELRSMAADASRGGFVPESAPMTQSPASAAAPANVPAQPTTLTQASLAAPLQSPAWPGQLGQQLVQFARHGGEQQIEMRLNPAELGPLSVTLKMTEQGAQAQFLSAHAQVRQVLEQAIPQLREALAEQGISLGETSVGEQRQQDAQAFAGHDGQRGQGAQSGGEDDLAMSGTGDTGTALSDGTLSLDGRVNLYA
ncbi:flagellar hook-length control protein FliK [Halomonas sp. A29]|uniref:flagellar hook-length control protein FliK n=1 Tax=Halomonas sp. A29 TaxID=3102786 RepID=UPI00398AC1C9